MPETGQGRPGLAARDLAMGYGGRRVIERLSLELGGAFFTALCGANGSGKSTLLRGLARLLSPQGGEVQLDGVPIMSRPSREVARRVAVLSQAPLAPEGMTVRALVEQGRYPHRGLFAGWTAADERAVSAALETTGMEALAERPLDTLSGGQRQRAWIAMTLAQETGIVLLDEPTTFLDLAHQVEVLALLRDLVDRQGASVVAVLHDLNQAARYADRIVLLKDGRIHAEGPPAAVIEPATIRAVFGLDCAIVADPTSGAPFCIPTGRLAKAE